MEKEEIMENNNSIVQQFSNVLQENDKGYIKKKRN